MRTSGNSILFLGQQIRAIAEGFFDRRAAPPFGHVRVVSPDEHLRHSPTSVLRRPRVVRKIQKTGRPDSWLGARAAPGMKRLGFSMSHPAEGFILRRSFVPQGPRQE